MCSSLGNHSANIPHLGLKRTKRGHSYQNAAKAIALVEGDLVRDVVICRENDYC